MTKKKQMEALQSFMDSLQEKPTEPKIQINTQDIEVPESPTLTDNELEIGAIETELDKSVQENIKELQKLNVPPTAPALTFEEMEELAKRQAKARSKNRGRPPKWKTVDVNGHTIREDGYRRTSMIVNIELAAKMKEIAFREGMTEKEVLEQAMRLAVESYEKQYGVLEPTERKKSLFS